MTIHFIGKLDFGLIEMPFGFDERMTTMEEGLHGEPFVAYACPTVNADRTLEM